MFSQAHNFEDRIRTKDVVLEEQINFNALLLSEETLGGLHNNGFRLPSPIQVKAIPIGRCGFDLIIKSKSGTGKTIVFSVIALELINVNNNCLQALILAPTREIAVQIQQVLKTLGSTFKDLRVESFIGGLPIDEDKKKLVKCHIAVGAPGRIKHLLQLDALKCRDVKLFVLDEADKLMNDNMKADVAYISKMLPSTKQVIASSATYSDEVMTNLENIMSSPTLVEPNTDTPLLLGLKQFVSVVKSNLNVLHQLNIKNEDLIRILSQITFSQCLVFTNYQARAESVSNTLNRKGWNSMYISAAQSQMDRLKVINLLKEGKCRILLSTDITARGIDAANIDLVINYDVPYEASTYLHRMGRAGRFGTHGICITIAAQGKDLDDYCKILGSIGGTNLFVSQLPKEENLPSDLWNADSGCFNLVQAMASENSNTNTKTEIASSITDLKLRRNNGKEKEIKVKDNMNEQVEVKCDSKMDEKSLEGIAKIYNAENEENTMLTQTADVDMSNIIETILQNNKKKEDNIKSDVVGVNALSLLQNLTTDKETSIIETTQTNIVHDENLLSEIAADMSTSKKRKRVIDSQISENVSSNEQLQSLQTEKTCNSNQLCKNLALLNATKLLCGLYGTNQISEEVVPPLDIYLKTINKNEIKEVFSVHSKEDILNTIEDGKVNNLLDKPIPMQNEPTTFKNVTTSFNDDLEDIFKLSFDYAINCGEKHWLNILGQELLEEMSITENLLDNDPHFSLSDMDASLLEVPKKRKQKARKKKTFKDFTQKYKKNTSDLINDQNMEQHDSQEIKEIENQVDQNYYYQAGLYSDYEYATNTHFTSCFDHYSDALAKKLQTFDNVQSFETWFAEWQWQMHGVRDYVQQNIYLQEINKYAYNKHS